MVSAGRKSAGRLCPVTFNFLFISCVEFPPAKISSPLLLMIAKPL